MELVIWKIEVQPLYLHKKWGEKHRSPSLVLYQFSALNYRKSIVENQ